ncbi:MAG: aconitase X catalytic domain-containing protein [Pseudomonadota bacterium]
MKLTDREKKMLDGGFGKGPQDAMQLLKTLGTVYDAERMIPVTTCHLGGRNVLLGGQENIDWMTDLYEGGARFQVFTSWNAGCCDFELWREMGLPEGLIEDQKRSDEIYIKFGAVPLGTCLPYYHGNLPMPGTSFAAGGSAGATYVNSMIGARGNREGSPSVVAAAICGVTPEYGLHLKENRYGKVVVDLSGLDYPSMTLGDFSALGYYIGRTLVDKTPVIVGLPKNISQDQIRFMISPMPTGGAISLVHIVGVTPEAPTVEEALGHRKPEDTISVTYKDLQSSYEKLTTTTAGKVDLVAFGCPHCSIGQIGQIALLLDGKKIHPDTRLWVATSRYFKMMAREMGYVDRIEKAGGLVISEVCVAPGAPFHLVKGVKTVAINSARGAYFIPGACGVEVIFADTKDCIDTALNGKWRGAK